MAGEQRPDAVVDLLGRDWTGPLWGMASSDLNATLLVWPAGRELAEDTNTELDVLLVVLEGGGVAVVEQQEHVLGPGNLLLIEKGTLAGNPRRSKRSALPLDPQTPGSFADRLTIRAALNCTPLVASSASAAHD